MSEEKAAPAVAADHDDVAKQSWDSVKAPVPFPREKKFKFQLIFATYRKADEEGGDQTYSYGFRAIAPIDAVDPAEMPEDWQSRKIVNRLRVPTWNSHFDAKAMTEMLGVKTEGLTREQANEVLKRTKPVVEASVKVRFWTDKQTGAQKFEESLVGVKLFTGTDAPGAAVQPAGEE